MSKGKHGVTSESLYQKWLIYPEADKSTVKHTPQRGIKTILHLYLSRQFKTNERLLRYNRLQYNIFTDKIQAGTVSRMMSWYDQSYSTQFGWSREHSIEKKGDAHGKLPLFFNIDGVTTKMVMYGLKEKTLGSFRKKRQEEDCHINKMEPHYP